MAQPERVHVPNQQGAAKEFSKDFVAGTLAGMASKLIGHPFDTVKVRLQAQGSKASGYRGGLDCARKMVKFEGFASLYRGMMAPMFGACLEIAVIFSSNTLFQRALSSEDDRIKGLSLPKIILAGGMAGACTAFVLTPIELVKCQLQVKTDKSKFGGSWHVLRNAFVKEGVRGFFRGHSGTLGRETFGNFAWFGMYEAMCRSLLLPGQTREEQSPLVLLTAGAMGGIFFWLIPFPYDVVKTRMQTGEGSFAEIARSIVKTEGVRGLYRGLPVTLLRAAPCNAVLFYIYETSFKYINTMY